MSNTGGEHGKFRLFLGSLVGGKKQEGGKTEGAFETKWCFIDFKREDLNDINLKMCV